MLSVSGAPPPQGYYCNKGTADALATREKCAIGYFCPSATAYGSAADARCPRLTTSMSGAYTLTQCIVSAVEVCDKGTINPSDPWEDRTYYPQFSYSLLDGSGGTMTFDSTVSTGSTGEVQVVEKINPINETASVPYYVNDTVEVFRTCPTYGRASDSTTLTVVGRNFRNTTLNFCRITVCVGSDLGPMSCLNRDGSRGSISNYTTVIPAVVQSSTRLLCPAPALGYVSNWTTGWASETGACVQANGSLALRRVGLSGSLEFNHDLFVHCTDTEVSEGYCANTPEAGLKLNPCYVSEVMVEVSNNADKWSGDGLEYAHTALDTETYNNHLDYSVPPTFAVFRYVVDKYYPNDTMLVDMDRQLCQRVLYAEEGQRTREVGWFRLTAMQQARMSFDLTHLPDDIVYGEHYTFGIFARPSRCDIQSCDASRSRNPPMEVSPCSMPMALPSWFLSKEVKKNQVLNLTMLALDDLVFKVEVHLLHGLFYPFVDFFKNTTTVEVIKPSRANDTTGQMAPETRRLSPFVAWEEPQVVVEYFFVAIYDYSTTAEVTAPLNLPDLYGAYERGRALLSFNSTHVNSAVPSVLESTASLTKGRSVGRQAGGPPLAPAS